MDELETVLQPRVLAVVVTHNGKRWLGESLKALAQSLFTPDIVVVDSGSDVPAAPVVEKTLPGAEFFRINRNVGFGTAANHGLEASEKAPEADFFLFMHDDVVVEPETISLLLAAALETEAGIVGGKALDWDHHETLLEVGMSADQFGYPFSGLEEGEIDQGQHDSRRETLYISSACMLVSKQLVERVGLWDGGFFAFAEDLDLCTRARISGFKVVVQPGASFRHALALSRKQRPTAAANKIRYYTRLNRSRLIAKNVAAYRMPFILLIYTAIGLAEILLLTLFRRFDELPAYPRALGAFVVSIPDIARRRRAVQKRRAAPDRRLRRFMVKDLHRARVFLEKHLRDLEVGTLAFAGRAISRLSPASLKEASGRWIRKPGSIPLTVIAAVFLFAIRWLVTSGQIAAGGLWPMPDATHKLLTNYLAGWRGVGLGTTSAAPPALLVLWLVTVVSFGKAVLAQKLLIVLLTGIGLFGMNRFVARRTSSTTARVFAVAIYALGPVMESIMTKADLGGLAAFAFVPFILEIGLRMLGPTPGEGGDRPSTAPTFDAMSRDLMRLCLMSALLICFAPSAVAALVALWLIAGLHLMVGAWDRRDLARRMRWVLASIPAALIILMPWSIEIFHASGSALAPLLSSATGTFAPLWVSADIAPFIFLAKRGDFIGSAVVIASVVGALVLTGPSRRRESRLLVVAWLFFGAIGATAALGFIPSPVTSPTMWMTFSAV
ncbi:MAG: glycosyltransferase family 2 protein, partial [Actinobacteria bacterium]|nr:glycosyltransferase family 2 protein [Actinomycetota bacterium]